MSTTPSQAKPQDQAVSYSAFVSYATKADKTEAFAIVGHLEELGLKCWIAPRNVRHGRAYGEEIIHGIEASGCLILVLSQAANDSKFVRKEVERAVSKDKSIFTMRIEDVQPSKKIELFISDIHWVDAWPGEMAPHVAQLAEMLLEGDEVPRPNRVVEIDERQVEPDRDESADDPSSAGQAQAEAEMRRRPDEIDQAAAKPAPGLKTKPARRRAAASMAGDVAGVALADRWRAFALKGLLLIAGGLPILLWALFPDSSLWAALPIPGAVVVPLTICILLSGGLALASSRRRETGALFTLDGVASVAIGIVLLGWMAFASDSALSGFPPTNPFLPDPFDPVILGWGIWASLSGGLSILAVPRLKGRIARTWLALASFASLLLGMGFILAACDSLDNGELEFFMLVGGLTVAAGTFFTLLGMSLRGQRELSPTAA